MIIINTNNNNNNNNNSQYIINGLTPWCRRPPFQGGAAGKGQNGPHAHQSCKYCRVFESLGSVNIDCGTMNAMY